MKKWQIVISLVMCFIVHSQTYNLYFKQSVFNISNTPDCEYTRNIKFEIFPTANNLYKYVDYKYLYSSEQDCFDPFCVFYKYVEKNNGFSEKTEFGKGFSNGVIPVNYNPQGLGYFASIGGCNTTTLNNSNSIIFDYTNYYKKAINVNLSGFKNNVTYIGEFVSVPRNKINPIILSPNINGIVNDTLATFLAPDFMLANFRPDQIEWIFSTPQLQVSKLGRQVDFSRSDFYCQPATVTVRVIDGYNWASEQVDFELHPTPNLVLDKTLIIEQPVCVENQKAGNDYKATGHILLSNEVMQRKFSASYVDKDGLPYTITLDKVPSEKYLSVEGSPYSDFVIEENFGNQIYSCKQSYPDIKVTPPLAIMIQPTFTDIQCFGQKPILNIEVNGNTNKYILDYGDSSKVLTKNQKYMIPLMTQSRIYNFTLKDENGCEYDQKMNFKATEPTKLEASLLIDTAVCFRGNANVKILAMGGTVYDLNNPYRYAFWPATGTQISSTFATKGGATVYPRVYDKNNCALTFPDLTLFNPKDFKVKILEHIDNICPKATQGKIVVGSISEDQRYTYTYSISDEAFSKDSLFSNLLSNTYKISVLNQNGCQKDTNVTITQPPIIQISKTALDSVRCYGESNGALSLSITGGTGQKRININNESIWTLGKTYTFSQTYDSLPEQTYWFYAEDSIGCKDSASYSITSKSHITHSSSLNNPSCNESSDGSIYVAISGGRQPYNHTWIERPELGSKLQQVSMSKGIYVLQTVDRLLCVKTDTFHLIAPPVLAVNLEGYPLLCKGQSLILDAGSGSTYKWGGSNGYSGNTKTVTVYQGGTYWVEVTNQFGCIGRDTFLLKESDTQLRADFLVATHIVKGDTAVLVNINPNLDSLKWKINPIYMRPIGNTINTTTQQVVFTALGENYVEMEGYYKGCRDIRKHKVFIIEPSERNKYDKQIGIKTSIIHSCNLFPNPNDGSFEINYELNEEGVPLLVTLSSMATGTVLKTLELQIYPDHKIKFEEDLPEGAYVIHIKARDEVIALRFLIAYD